MTDIPGAHLYYVVGLPDRLPVNFLTCCQEMGTTVAVNAVVTRKVPKVSALYSLLLKFHGEGYRLPIRCAPREIDSPDLIGGRNFSLLKGY